MLWLVISFQYYFQIAIVVKTEGTIFGLERAF